MAKLAEPRVRARAVGSGRTRRDVLVATLIVAVAALTRLTFANLAEFKSDEATVLLRTVALLEGRAIPLTGIISSAGINNPPIFVYLLAIPVAISRDPAVAAGFVGLLAVGAVLLTYRLCVEVFDRRTAQVAALLFATAPWAVVLTRRLQAQDVVPFFTLLWMGALFNFGRGRGAYHLAGVGLWLSVLLQVHQATVALIPLTALVLVVERRRWRDPGVVRWALVGIALAAVLWVPYLIFQLTHHLADLEALRRVTGAPAQISLDHLAWIVDLAASNGFYSLTGVGTTAYRAATFSFDGLYLVERLLFFAGLAFLLGRLAVGRPRGDWRLVILLLWLAVPPLFFVRHTFPLYNYYFMDVYPTQFILIGLLVSGAETWVGERFSAIWRQRLTFATSLLVAVIAAAQVYGFVTLMQFVSTQSTLGGHDLPLRDRETAVARLAGLSVGSAQPSYVAASGSDADAIGYLAASQVRYKIFDDRDTFVIPPSHGQPTVYLTADPTRPVAAFMRQQFAAHRVATLPYPGQTTGFDLFRLPADAGAELLRRAAPRPLDRTASNGTRLVGYDLGPTATAGAPLRLALYWQVVAAPPPGAAYSFFTHLVDDQGRLWAQEDDLDYPPALWTPGELVISWFTLQPGASLPAGRGWIEAGVYNRDGVKRLPLRADDGTTSDHVMLGPLKLVPANPPPAAPPAHLQAARFGDAVELRGYDLAGDARPGSTLTVTLTWAALHNPGVDLASFVHLLDASGRLVAQSDGRPGPYPTSVWQPGDLTRDARPIALPASLPSGTYRLEVGLYRRDTQARLPTGGGDHLILETPIVIHSYQ